MEVKSHVEILRLHCEHMSVLLAQLITDLTTIERSLTTDENPSFASVASYVKGWEAQGEKIATESVRLQSFMHSLTKAPNGAVESQENTSSTVGTPPA